MTLPAELLDYILSFLQSDPTALKACSESHSSLCQLAEPHLYSHILLKTHHESADLAEVLSKRPYIVHYILSLEIYVGGDYGTETQHRLEEIATILPNLLALREITFDHSPSFEWEEEFESFHPAWLDCLRLQSMRDVCITHVVSFSSFSSNGERKSIRALTVRGGYLWQRPSPSRRTNDVDWDGLFIIHDRPLATCAQKTKEWFLQEFVPWFAPWFATCRSQLPSLEFFSLSSRSYDSLPELLASSSNSLTNFDLNLGLARTRTSFLDILQLNNCTFTPFADYYDFNIPLITHDATTIQTIPVTLSTLPHLEQLTIRAVLRYIATTEQWGFYSPIPVIKRLFSSNIPSLKHLILDFDFTIVSPSLVQTESLPWSSLSEVVCNPLVHLLSTIFECSGSSSSSVVSIQVDLRLDVPLTGHLSATPGPKPRIIPAYIIHSFLSKSKELMQFVERGRLTITPPVATFSDISVSDYW